MKSTLHIRPRSSYRCMVNRKLLGRCIWQSHWLTVLSAKFQRETDGRKLSSEEKERLRHRVMRRSEAGVHPEDATRDLDSGLRSAGGWKSITMWLRTR